MSRIEDDKFIIEHENLQQCDLCGKIAELRPYGPNGECICIDCGMKDKETTRKQYYKILNSVKEIEIKDNH